MAYTIVTGASSDIGKAICIELSKKGHSLLMLDIDEQSMLNIIPGLSNSQSHKVLALDFSDTEESNAKLKNYLINNQLSIESAVFAAGIFSVKPLRMIKHDLFIKSLDIAIFSVMQIMQLVTSKKTNCGSFKSAVIISSISARQGVKGYSLYSVVKAGLLGLTHSLAVEFAPARINAILPGGIRTRATAFIYDNKENLDSRSLLGEGEPNDIADIVEFLLSDASKWITGQEFVIDGGSNIN